jgi:Mg2+-importing ATPase
MSRRGPESERSELAFWALDRRDLVARLGSRDAGLTSAEADERLRRFGPGGIRDEARFSALTLLARQFASPLVLILVFGAAVSLLMRTWLDAWIILAVVLGSALLGFLQEYRASASVARLKQRLALTARALRDGVARTVPATSIVPGDVIVLAAGNLVPADGLLLEAEDFLVSEAALTGESLPVEKRPGILPVETPVPGRTNAVFLGTSVRSGTATVLVAATGLHTAFGDAARRLASKAPEPDFARGVRRFGYTLVRIMVVLVLGVLTANLLLGRPIIESLLFSVALAVGLSPELLPAIMSVTLAAGAARLADRGVIVRRLEAIEDLGGMDVLCTDKTGTLTEGTVALSDSVDVDGRPSADVQRAAFVNSAFETGIENPLDLAVVAAGEKAGLSIEGCTKIDEIPYDFIRRRLTIVVDEGGAHHRIVTKGAFANVLAICSAVARDGCEAALDAAERGKLEAYYRKQGEEGFRVLAVATRTVGRKPRYDHADEAGMCFAGFLLFLDPPKAEARRAIGALAALGVRVKVLTGDNRYVAAHVAEAVGLASDAVLTGEDIDRMKDEALLHHAGLADLFAEIDPQQKERIVRALQRVGHAVGFLGDGINDAPALHAADVGISVDGAVDVAREAADIVLLEPDLDVLRNGVEYGRRTFANTLKYVSITTSANFGNMISMAVAAPLLPFLPLAAKQILLNNFLSDLPSLAIASDEVEARQIASPQRWDIAAVRSFMIVFGLISTVFDFLTFATLLYGFGADTETFRTAWFIVSLLTELAVVLVLRTPGPALRSAPSPLLLWLTVAVALLALALPYVGPVAALFDFVPLPAHVMAAMLAITLGYLAVTETAKLRFFARRGPRQKTSLSA